MEQNTTNEVIEQVVEEATKSNNSGKNVGILGVGILAGVGLMVAFKKIAKKIRDKKAIVVDQATDETKEEDILDEE